MLTLRDEGEPIDPVLIADRLRPLGYTDNRAGDFMLRCMEVTITPANLDAYIGVVSKEGQRRKLSSLADRLKNGARYGAEPAELIGELTEAIAELETGSGENGVKSSVSAAVDWYDRYNLIAEHPEKAFCSTGYKSLDRVLCGGMINGGVYIVGARPGMGKTTFALNMAERIAKNRPVLFVSEEMSTEQITAKRIARITGYGVMQLMTGGLKPDELSAVVQTLSYISKSRLYVTDEFLTPPEIASRARAINELGCVVIDYLGIMPKDEHVATERDRITELSGEITRMAKRLQVPVVLLCQLNREPTRSRDKRPTMADLRDSGAIEQDATAVLLLHREGYYKQDRETPQTGREPLEVIVAKDRFGGVGTVKLSWDGATGDITEIDPRLNEVF